MLSGITVRVSSVVSVRVCGCECVNVCVCVCVSMFVRGVAFPIISLA